MTEHFLWRAFNEYTGPLGGFASISFLLLGIMYTKEIGAYAVLFGMPIVAYIGWLIFIMEYKVKNR